MLVLVLVLVLVLMVMMSGISASSSNELLLLRWWRSLVGVVTKEAVLWHLNR